ncbi:polyphosphate kinase 2 family protein [Propionibacteriaceae bacterium G1746]|uniref:polyphosphate kinase 2 family protein n=1 Tax=Aestuariimicrobium sp. G57 TaxID=3418485 RepID=UPI003C26944A
MPKTKRTPKTASAKKTSVKKPVKKPVQAAPESASPIPRIPSVVPNSGLADKLRLPPGPVDLASLDPRSTVGFPGKGKDDAPNVQADMVGRLSEVQERLYAQGRELPATAPRVLLILQGLDTSGKGGVIRHAIGMVDPQGVHIKGFKSPTPEELEHDFLWRIEKELPAPGQIGVFDRSQYEDVLVVRVEQLVPREEWESRYERINEFESRLRDQGITVIKCYLNVSKDEQKARLAERLERPDKYWKYNPGDLGTRAKWDDYQAAYADALGRCNTDHAPWYIIPADRKWYRNWAVAQLLLEHLEGLDLQWPAADFDVEEQKLLLARA